MGASCAHTAVPTLRPHATPLHTMRRLRVDLRPSLLSSFKSELCSHRRPHCGHPFMPRRLRVDPRPSLLSSLRSELRAHTAAHTLRPHGRRPFHAMTTIGRSPNIAMTTIGRSPNISAWSYCCGRGRLLSWVRCACRAAHTSSPPSMHTEALEQNIVY